MFTRERVFFDAPDGSGEAPSQASNVDFLNNPFGNQPDVADPGAPPAGGTPPEGGTPPAGSPPAQSASSVDRYWKVLSNRLSTEETKYEIPEHIVKGVRGDAPLTDEEAFDELLGVIHANTKFAELEDPFISDYIKSRKLLNENFDFAQWLDGYAKPQTQMTLMNDNDYLFNVYKEENGKSDTNPNGWEDSDIREHLEKMGRIQMTKERKAHEEVAVAKRNQQLQAIQDQKIQQQRQKVTEMQAVIDSEIKNLELEIAKNPVVNGIRIGESDLKNAIEEYRVLSTYDNSGNRPIYDLFNDEANLFKAYIFLRNDAALLKDLLSAAKSDAAKSILDRTSINPGVGGATSGGGFKLPTPADFID